MVKSGLVLACVALAQWVSAQQAPQMEALPIDPLSLIHISEPTRPY